MSIQYHRSLSFILAFVLTAAVHGQGIQRSSGVTFRGSLWDMTSSDLGLSFQTGGTTNKVSVQGLGVWIGYITRISPRWFLDFNTGAVSRINVEEKSSLESELDLNFVFPLMLGMRFDPLSARIPTRLQPYFSFGTGSYFQTSITGTSAPLADSVNTEASLDFGGYLGGGMNIAFTSWIGLNLDLKYHIVDFDRNHGISGVELGLGINFMWGKKRDLFRVKETRLIVRDLYPAYHNFYSTYPLALVTVQNTAGFPIEVNVRSELRPYSSRAKDSGFVTIERGEATDIPVTAILDPEIFTATQRQPAVLDIEVEGRAGTTFKKHISEQILIHTRNSWDGQMDKLSFFLTPDDAEVIALGRRLVSEIGDSLAGTPGNMVRARRLFEGLNALKIRYLSDPNIPFYQDDRVQYAAETLMLKHGDCDDMVVLFASMLESMAINTAFVEVRDPRESIAHLYLIFDSGLTLEESHVITPNRKRLIAREAANGKQQAWIPVESTLLNRGFDAAWESGALQFLEQGQLRNGLAENWVRIIDVE